MKVELSHREANLVMCVLHELAFERGTVTGTWHPLWRLTDKGVDVARVVMDKLEDANDETNRKTGKDRDLSGAPKGTIQEAKWSA